MHDYVYDCLPNFDDYLISNKAIHSHVTRMSKHIYQKYYIELIMVCYQQFCGIN